MKNLPINDKKYNSMSEQDLSEELLIATLNGDLDLVKYLLTSPNLKKHAYVGYVNNLAMIDIPALSDIFMVAASKGHLEIIKYLVKENVDITINKKNIDYENALILAVKNKHIDIVKYLLNSSEVKSHFDINSLNMLNENSLFISCKNNDLEMVKALLDFTEQKDLNIYHKNNAGNNFLMYACIKGDDQLIKFVFEYKLVDRKLCQDKDVGGMSAIHYLGVQNVELLDYLLTNNKNIDIDNNTIQGIFNSALTKDNLEVAQYLLTNEKTKNFINIFDMNNDNESLFFKACYLKSNKILKYLLIDLNIEVKEVVLNLLKEKSEKDFFRDKYIGVLEMIKTRDFYNKIDNNLSSTNKVMPKIKI